MPLHLRLHDGYTASVLRRQGESDDHALLKTRNLLKADYPPKVAHRGPKRCQKDV